MPRTFVSCGLILAMLLGLKINAAEDAASVDKQLREMRAQLQAMAEKIGVQQKKLDEQAKTIEALKDNQAPVAAEPASEGPSKTGVAQPTTGNAGLKQSNHTAIIGLGGGGDANQKKPGDRLLSFDMPPVTVTEERTGLREEELIGPYDQPRWTARRRFLETRSYVLPEGSFEVENWNIIEQPRHGDIMIEQKYEAEIGLPHRLQLDLYGITNGTGNGKSLKFDEQDIELRWAWANWDVIPGNPTSYVEYKLMDNQPDHFETKLLFADDTPVRGLHWAANPVWEHTLGGRRDNSYEFNTGLSYTIKDEKFSVGLEEKLEYDDELGHRGLHQPAQLLIGPSFQVTPLKRMHIDFAPLAGVTKNSSKFKALVIFGWEF